jgi:DNA ligase-4
MRKVSQLSSYVWDPKLMVDPRCRAQVRKGLSLVKPQWIYESIKRKRKLPLLESYVLLRVDRLS